MSTQKKTWILVRGTQYQPGGAISLGQLLTKPCEPSLPLLPDGPLPIDPSYIERTYQTSVEVGSASSLGVSFQFWANVDLLPVQGEINTKYHTSESTAWAFDRLDCEIMVPRLRDVQIAISQDEVVAQINRKKFDFRKRIYMITGVRVARGARLKQHDSRTIGADVKLGVDLAGFTGAPVTLGPGVGVSNTASNNYSFGSSSDFVYAYRVCEVHYGKDVYVKPHNKGDTFGLWNGQEEEIDVEEKEKEEKLQRIVVEDIASSDYDGFGIPHKTFPFGSSEGNEEEEFLLPE